MVLVQSGDVETQLCPYFLVSVGLITGGTEQWRTRLSDAQGSERSQRVQGAQKNLLTPPALQRFLWEDTIQYKPCSPEENVLQSWWKKVAILFQFEVVDVMWNIKVVIGGISQENLAERKNKEERKQNDGCAVFYRQYSNTMKTAGAVGNW